MGSDMEMDNLDLWMFGGYRAIHRLRKLMPGL